MEKEKKKKIGIGKEAKKGRRNKKYTAAFPVPPFPLLNAFGLDINDAFQRGISLCGLF